jgi:hypothetical protein
MDQLVIMEYGELDTIMNPTSFFGEPDIFREIKAGRVKWLGHLFRTNECHL